MSDILSVFPREGNGRNILHGVIPQNAQVVNARAVLPSETMDRKHSNGGGGGILDVTDQVTPAHASIYAGQLMFRWDGLKSSSGDSESARECGVFGTFADLKEDALRESMFVGVSMNDIFHSKQSLSSDRVTVLVNGPMLVSNVAQQDICPYDTLMWDLPEVGVARGPAARRSSAECIPVIRAVSAVGIRDLVVRIINGIRAAAPIEQTSRGLLSATDYNHIDTQATKAAGAGGQKDLILGGFIAAALSDAIQRRVIGTATHHVKAGEPVYVMIQRT